MEAVVTGVESFGLFVQGIELPAEGLIRTELLLDDHYHFDRATHTLAGHRSGNLYRLGDRLRVVVARVDLERRELDFRLVSSEPRREAKAEAPTRARKSTQPRKPTQPRKSTQPEKAVKTKKAAKKGRKSPKKKPVKKQAKRKTRVKRRRQQ